MLPHANSQYGIEAPLPVSGRNHGAEADCIIIGGGLAGLSSSILLARQGWRVLLFEKNKYPFHRVCGEYISMESKPFLERLGLKIDPSIYPHIHRLQVTAASGIEVNRPLGLGGFGISRYELDYQVSQVAINAGVTLINERVDDVNFTEEKFVVKTGKEIYSSRLCIGSFGKRSNLDVKMQRPFIKSAAKGLNNYLGIKYHIRFPQPKDLIALHNFRNGYCGISSIEDNKCCLCYLTTANNLASNGHDIAVMEKKILFKNRNLAKIFSEAEFLYKEPMVISQVSFAYKEQDARNIIFCGDAAGLITPLCGNGMSMALKASHMLAPLADLFLNNDISLEEVKKQYRSQWEREFSKRLQFGRRVQMLFGNNLLTTAFVQTCRIFPQLADSLIKKSHGKVY